MGHHKAQISAEDQARIASLADRVRAENPRLCRIPQLADTLECGLLDAPALLIEDHSAIQLADDRRADANLGYRIMLLGREGDLLALYGERHLAFEAYCRDRLGLGRVEVIAPPLANARQSLASACLADGQLIEQAVQRAQSSGGLNIIPYMASGSIWRLAGKIAALAKVPIRLAGPPPALMRAVNDKLWFARWAQRLLGRHAVPPSRAVYGMAAMAGYLRRFMRQHRQVAIKLSHSAASLGNLVLASADFANLSASAVSARLQEMFDQKGWQNPFPLQVTAWEAPLIATPSAQLWIPHPEDGAPILEGVFDQITVNTNARFVGAVPSDLPQAVQARVVEGAFRLGLLFQKLGYFGRCSFDAVLVEDGGKAPLLHWVECNGRWGGVSIPMTLSNRLLGDWKCRDMMVVEKHIAGPHALTTQQFLRSCESELLCSGGDGSGAVLLSPGGLSHGAYNLLILGLDRQDVLLRSTRCTKLLGNSTL